MGKFKLILWDIGNVLNVADQTITHRVLMDYGVPEERATQFFTTPAYTDFARGKMSGLDFYHHQVVENLHYDLTLLEVVEAHDQHMIAPDLVALSLPARCRVPIAFATSTNIWQTRRERALIGDIKRFNPVWTFRSNLFGMLKTDPGCMRFVASQLERLTGVQPQEIVFIDDAPGNREAAQTAGFQTYEYVANTGACACEEFLAENGLIN